jgi:hypothetical protein
MKKIRKRPLLLGGLVFVQVLLLAYAQYLMTGKNQQSIASFQSHGMALYELQINALQLRRYEKDYFLAANDPAERARYRQLWSDHRNLFDTQLRSAMRSDSFEVSEQKQFQAWAELIKRYGDDFQRSIKAVETEIDTQGSVRDIASAYAQMGEARKAIRIVLSEALAITDREYKTMGTTWNRIEWVNRALFLVALLFAVLLYFLIRAGAVMSGRRYGLGES